MGSEHHPELRGFDSYELKLGDELRGERASLGKSLLDVQRDLRIRADYIAAIEAADATAFPFAGFAAGYVRAYARYLNLDEDDIYRRFCAESGFVGVAPTATVDPREIIAAAAPKGPSLSRPAPTSTPISTRFLASNRAQERVATGAALRGLGSVAMLGTIVIGLGYGGWTLLQDLQRLGFAPLPTAPAVLVAAPEIPAPPEGAFALAPAPAEDGGPRVSLAAIYAAQESGPPAPVLRDGPISSIDPRSAGIYAHPAASRQPLVAGPALLTETETPYAAVERATVEPAPVAAAPEAEPVEAPRGVDVFALEEAWIRVRDGERRVLFTGILGPGERFSLPPEAEAPQLRAGNAGAVYIIVDGAAFGPLGSGPNVASNVDLKPDSVRAAYPEAAGIAPQPAPSRNAEAARPALAGEVALRSD